MDIQFYKLPHANGFQVEAMSGGQPIRFKVYEFEIPPSIDVPTYLKYLAKQKFEAIKKGAD